MKTKSLFFEKIFKFRQTFFRQFKKRRHKFVYSCCMYKVMSAGFDYADCIWTTNGENDDDTTHANEWVTACALKCMETAQGEYI